MLSGERSSIDSGGAEVLRSGWFFRKWKDRLKSSTRLLSDARVKA
jgi:hypothetical protein